MTKEIKIIIDNGVILDVLGLPDTWVYEVEDRSND